MALSKRLAWIAAGFAAAVAAGALAVGIRNWFINPADAIVMSGMYAAADLILFVWTAGALGLVPAFFLMRLAMEIFPRALPWTLFALSATGPASWWVLSAGLSKIGGLPQGVHELVGVA